MWIPLHSDGFVLFNVLQIIVYGKQYVNSVHYLQLVALAFWEKNIFSSKETDCNGILSDEDQQGHVRRARGLQLRYISFLKQY